MLHFKYASHSKSHNISPHFFLRSTLRLIYTLLSLASIISMFSSFSHFLQRIWPWGVLLLTSVGLHGIFLSSPPIVVYDEALFGKFSSFYATRQYFFDLHPPHGKLLIAAINYLAGMPENFHFTPVVTPYTDSFYLYARALPAAAGTILPILMAALAREIGIRPFIALTCGWLVLLDNALLIISRFILPDMLMLSAGIAGWLAYARYRRKGTRFMLILSALCLGGAFSIKWTGLGFSIIIAFVWLHDFIKQPNKNALLAAIILITIPALWYVGGFAVHFALLKPSPAEIHLFPDDPDGLKCPPIEKQNALVAKDFWTKFTETNRCMWNVPKGMSKVYPYSSPWYTWPFGFRSIWYATDSKYPTNPAVEKQLGATQLTWLKEHLNYYFFSPNLIIWWLAAIAMIGLILRLTWYGYTRLIRHDICLISKQELLLVGAWFANILPFVFIQRFMFSYHYLPCLLISILSLAWWAERLSPSRQIIQLIMAFSLIFFIWMSPLTYGFGLSQTDIKSRLFINGWLGKIFAVPTYQIRYFRQSAAKNTAPVIYDFDAPRPQIPQKAP